MKTNKSFESVIPTAILTAYPRVLSDIPYAAEVFDELKKETIADNLIIDKLAPEIEARYKLINKLLKESKINQILELAAGYSTRGIDLAEHDDRISYVEIDLPQVALKKKGVLRSFTNIPRNLHILSGNALSSVDIDKSGQFFDANSPVVIINEGLLRYLDFEEKKKVAVNIHALLSKHGGIWITCDVTSKKFVINQDKNMAGFNKNLSEVSQRNNANWRFENIGHVKKFFGQIGFKVEEVHPFGEIKGELVSPKKLKLDDTEVGELLKDAVVVVMKVDK